MDFSSSKGKFKEQTFEEFTLNGGFKTQPHITVKTIFHEAMLSLSQLHEKKLCKFKLKQAWKLKFEEATIYLRKKRLNASLMVLH